MKHRERDAIAARVQRVVRRSPVRYICELAVTEFRIPTGGVLMFCPKCGQEQASESVRFCSRCGFKLNIVDEPLAKRLVKITMFLVLAVCAIMGWASIASGPNYMQLRLITTLIAVITFYLLFSRDLKHIFHKLLSQDIEHIKQITAAGERAVLPPAQSIPVSALGPQRVNTAEMVPPPSITEQTTTRLDKSKR
jgi:uncharacterized protein (DUF983 family)